MVWNGLMREIFDASHATARQRASARRNAFNRPWDSSRHYRQLAHRLRGIAAGCSLPNPQRELLNLAAQYERQANHFDAQQELQ